MFEVTGGHGAVDSAVVAGSLEEGSATMVEHLGSEPGASSKGRTQSAIILEEHEDSTQDASQAQQSSGEIGFF